MCGGGKGIGLLALAGIAIATGGFGLAEEAGLADGALAAGAEGAAAAGAAEGAIGASSLGGAAAADAAGALATGAEVAGAAAPLAELATGAEIATQAAPVVEGINQGANLANTVAQAGGATNAVAPGITNAVAPGAADVAAGGAMDMGVGTKELLALEPAKTGIIDSVTGWYKNLNPLERLAVGQVAGGVVKGVGEGAFAYMSQKEKLAADRKLSMDLVNAKTQAEKDIIQAKLDAVRNSSAGGVGVNLNGLASANQVLKRSDGTNVWKNGIINRSMIG